MVLATFILFCFSSSHVTRNKLNTATDFMSVTPAPAKIFEIQGAKPAYLLTMFLFFEQINLDSKTREETAVKMSSPDRATFEVAQKRIQALMAKDSYPRFLRSEFYRQQLTQFKLSPTTLAST